MKQTFYDPIFNEERYSMLSQVQADSNVAELGGDIFLVTQLASDDRRVLTGLMGQIGVNQVFTKNILLNPELQKMVTINNSGFKQFLLELFIPKQPLLNHIFISSFLTSLDLLTAFKGICTFTKNTAYEAENPCIHVYYLSPQSPARIAIEVALKLTKITGIPAEEFKAAGLHLHFFKREIVRGQKLTRISLSLPKTFLYHKDSGLLELEQQQKEVRSPAKAGTVGL